MASKRTHLPFLPTYLGAGVGFVAYLVMGAVPGLLYGGYMGLAMSGVLFGAPVEATLAAKVITFGGMLLGLAASFAFFMVFGALLGTGAGLPFARTLRRLAAPRTTAHSTGAAA